MSVLVINCGSSSLKFEVFNSDGPLESIAAGTYGGLGTETSQLSLTLNGQKQKHDTGSLDHAGAFGDMIGRLRGAGLLTKEPIGIGHRVVHGGAQYSQPVIIDTAVEKGIEALSEFAPLHNPVNLMGIRLAKEHFANVPHVAVFDTAFHQTMPPVAYRYAVPQNWFSQYGVRRYGFHGSSHPYVFAQGAKLLGIAPEKFRAVTCHLGNGASVAAVAGGRSLDTSMGFGPLEGLVMGTRSGDLDPTLIQFAADKMGLSVEQIFNALNKESGLLGLSGSTRDMRDLLAAESSHPDSQLAIDLFCYRLRKYIMAYLGVLASEVADDSQVPAHGVIFTGGIGENAAEVRRRTIAGLEYFGLAIDANLNAAGLGEKGAVVISPPAAKIKVVVVATDEERYIAERVCKVLDT